MLNSSLLFALTGSLTLLACSTGVDGNGHRVERTRETAAFSRIRSDLELDVQVVQGEQQSLTISLDCWTWSRRASSATRCG